MMINKKLVAGLSLAPLAVLAETPGSTTMDTTAAVSMITAAKEGLVSLLSSVAPIITAIVLAGLAIWAAIVVVRIVKRAFNAGK